MGTRGPRSTASLTVISPGAGGDRQPPPPVLTESEADRWKDILASMPAAWCRPGDVPLLVAFLQAESQLAAATAALDGAPLTLEVRGRRYRNPLLDVQDQAARRLASLGGKLRLNPSSRSRQSGAKDSTPTTRKPWE